MKPGRRHKGERNYELTDQIGRKTDRGQTSEKPAPRQDIAPFCDDCARSQNLPATGPQHYGRCAYCDLMRACYGDPPPMSRRAEDDVSTAWLDREAQTLLSTTLRHDLCHLMAHGHCRLELSRQLYEGYKAAHDGKAPDEMGYEVRKYKKLLPKTFEIGEPCGYGMFELVRWLTWSEGGAHLIKGVNLPALRALREEEKQGAESKKRRKSPA
jgi:hypothetical protein